MTGTRKPQQDGSIQAVLRDAGLESAAELRGALENLQALVPDQAPAPRADLAALLAAGGPATAASEESADSVEEPPLPAGVASLAAHRRSRGNRRRMALVGGAVVGAMTLGAGAVAAASQDFRDSVGHTVGSIFRPAGNAPAPTPSTVRPSPSDLPAAPAPVPAPAGTVTVPTVQATAPAAVPVPVRPTTSATQPGLGRDVGRTGVLPTPPQRPVTPVIPGADGRSIPVSPLPTVPAIPEVPDGTVQR